MTDPYPNPNQMEHDMTDVAQAEAQQVQAQDLTAAELALSLIHI